MLLEHERKRPRIHPSAWVAPSAVVCGDVRIGARTRVLHGAVITAETGPVRVGDECIIMEQTVLRGVKRHHLTVGDFTLVGPHAHLSGCSIEPRCFLATGCSVFNGAVVGQGSVVRIGGIVHVNTRLPAGTSMSIGWIAVGDPPRILPPSAGEEVLARLAEQGFSPTVFGLPAGGDMAELTARYSRGLGAYADARIIGEPASGERL